MLSKIIKDLMENFNNLKTSNKEMLYRIKCLEGDFEEEVDEESESEDFKSFSSSQLPIE